MSNIMSTAHEYREPKVNTFRVGSLVIGKRNGTIMMVLASTPMQVRAVCLVSNSAYNIGQMSEFDPNCFVPYYGTVTITHSK